ncbi:MAG: undecaprenyl-diphosphate phosphatase [Candidatus Eremiobacteraeota bacterium]|nr:undecaprenyl-diphosphate phosphatase [Candidatus Eremiobacteraeota bacterium]
MTFLQAMALAILQGISELFPVSSLGHTVLIPALLRWPVDRSDPTFLAFVVALHLGTAIALVVFYRKDWIRIASGLVRSVITGKLDEPGARLGWLLVAGTIPLAIAGVFLQHPVRAMFGSSALVAGFLILNGLVMFFGERLRRVERGPGSPPPKDIEGLSFRSAATIGLSQAAALFPGISRSGASIVTGLLHDLTHDDAARFSFLLATPAIGAASVLEIPRLFVPEAHGILVESAIGAVVAGVTAYGSVAFLTRYFHTNDLRPFGWYCLIFGGVCLVLALTKVIA